MPNISEGAPVAASSGNSWQAVDGTFDTSWRSGVAPSGQNPAWISVDLRGSSPSEIVFAWYNATSQYRVAQEAYSLPHDYVIEVSLDSTDGSNGTWNTVVSVDGNQYHSRQHAIDATGAGWIRMVTTSTLGAPPNDDVSINLTIHDVSHANDDNWLFLGDSITAGWAATRTINHVPSLAELVHHQRPWAYPLIENGGMPGWKASDAVRAITEDHWLEMFPGRFVVLSYGTNDAAAGSDSTFKANLEILIEESIEAGKIPVIPTIPWSPSPAIQAGVPQLNDRIHELYAEHPELLAGPDLWSLFADDPNREHYFTVDGIHPTDEGYALMRKAWGDWMTSTVCVGLEE